MSQRLNRRQLLQMTGAAGAGWGFGVLPGPFAEGATGDDPHRSLDDYIPRAMAEWHVPGLAIAVVKDGDTVLSRGYGVRKLGERAPVTDETMFALGSVTKSFTAACVALLVDEGKLSWDDPVVRHLPEFQLCDPWVTREITLRDVLCHRSGLPLGNMLWQNGAFDRAEVLRRLRHLRPAGELGAGFRSRFSYHNILYVAAGEVVARVSGTSWEEFVRRRLFEPLGMKSSSATSAGMRAAANAATGHAQLDGNARDGKGGSGEIGGDVRTVEWHDRDHIGPAGSINASVRDLAAWLKLHLAEGRLEAGTGPRADMGNGKGSRLLSVESVRELHAAQMAMPGTLGDGTVYPRCNFQAYGLGWFVRDYRGRKVVEHSGTANGFVAWVALLPDLQVGLAVLANLDGTGINFALRHRVLDAYLGEPERDWSAVVKQDYEQGYRRELREGRARYERERVRDGQPSRPLEEYAGDYESELYGRLKVRMQNGKLTLRYGTRFTGEAAHWQRDTFRVTFDNPLLDEWMIEFGVNGAGRVETLGARETPWAPAYMEAPDLGEFRRVPV